MKSDLMFSSKSNEWSTPQNLFDELDQEFNFTLDVCATEENAKVDKFHTIETDGLKASWKNEICFMNPPYGREIGKWIKKAYEETRKNNTIVVCLIPARTDTKYFHNYIYNKAEIRFLKGRLKFGDSKNSAPFPSMIIIFKKGDKNLKVVKGGLKMHKISDGIKAPYHVYFEKEKEGVYSGSVTVKLNGFKNCVIIAKNGELIQLDMTVEEVDRFDKQVRNLKKLYKEEREKNERL